MSKGIYCYVDNETGLIDYIGKDSNIHKDKRHGDHHYPSNYDQQPFNRILQNNPNRWEYQRLYGSDDVDDETLNQLEISFIERYNPRFNFTEGGDGCKFWEGKTFSDEHKQKLSEAKKGKIHSEETKKKMCESHKKKYARIVKYGFHNNKRRYAIRYECKDLKTSIHIDKLCEWFFKEYPEIPLHVEVNNGS